MVANAVLAVPFRDVASDEKEGANASRRRLDARFHGQNGNRFSNQFMVPER
jgi:hypothetical protein